jgi:hypothetical protein
MVRNPSLGKYSTGVSIGTPAPLMVAYSVMDPEPIRSTTAPGRSCNIVNELSPHLFIEKRC